MNIARTLCALLSAALIVGCTPAASENSQALRLSVGVMPAVDSAPIFLAEAEGYFRELGLDATITVYTNAMNRQSALQSGGLDGAMTDVIALVNNVENGFAIKVTTGTDGMFPVLVRPGFSDAASVKIGMMEVSVTNFLADRALSGTYELEKVYVNEIPARLELLGQGCWTCRSSLSPWRRRASFRA
jgi:NitT/TauT family transport system substrate-binding protein